MTAPEPSGIEASSALTSPFESLRASCLAASGEGALLGEDITLTFGALFERVERIMGFLLDAGWTPGQTVGVAVSNEGLHLVTALALMSLGAPHVGLPGVETGASNRKVAERVGVSLLIADRPQTWAEGLRTVIVSDEAIARCAPPSILPTAPEAEAVAVYTKTSGSTDAPKIFAQSFAFMAAYAAQFASRPDEARVMRTSSTDFDSTRLYRIAALLAGRPTVFAPRDLGRAAEIAARFDVTQIHAGPYALAAMVAGGRRLPAATSVMTGGARVPGALREATAQRLTNRLFVSYATSEIGRISLATPDQHSAFPEGVGFAEPDTTIEIIAADGAPASPGEVGEIRVRRPTATRRYVGQDTDAAQFRNGWFYPRDLVSQADGEPLIHHGRVDDVMLLNGVKVSGHAIEDALTAMPGVREATAFATPSRLHGEIPSAAVVFADGAERREPSELLAKCREILGIRAPRRIVVVDAIPRTPTGKPLKRELASL